MAHAHRVANNKLISKLPAKDRERFVAACTSVDLPFKQLVTQSEDPIAHVYFPTGAYLSLLRPIDGHNVEVALAGDEGMFGWPLSVGVNISNVQALVQGEGTALRLSPNAFRKQLTLSAPLRNTIGRYVHVLMSQFAQTVACNRFHVVEERLARWLLMTADRAHSNTFRITQEFLANMLGVRRAGVTKAAGRLQAKGFIRYKRGSVAVLDRRGLEEAACECYRVNLDTYRRVLG